jgi:hypothetical protein
MRYEKRTSKKNYNNNITSTKCSDSISDGLESSLVEDNDISLMLYSAIQSAWYQHQLNNSDFPCLEVLANIAAEELHRAYNPRPAPR